MNHIYNLIDTLATDGGTILCLVLLFLVCFTTYAYVGSEAAKEHSNLILGCLLGILKTERDKGRSIGKLYEESLKEHKNA